MLEYMHLKRVLYSQPPTGIKPTAHDGFRCYQLGKYGVWWMLHVIKVFFVYMSRRIDNLGFVLIKKTCISQTNILLYCPSCIQLN